MEALELKALNIRLDDLIKTLKELSNAQTKVRYVIQILDERISKIEKEIWDVDDPEREG
jgi:hypothetical protein